MAIPMLKQLIFEKKITQKELAEKLGISEAVLSKWVQGKSYPKPEDYYKLAKILGVKMEDMYKWEE